MMTLNNTVYATGEGTPLVLVHAFPVDHRMWDDCAEQIARQARETGDPAVTVWAPDIAAPGPVRFPSRPTAGGWRPTGRSRTRST